MHVSIRVRGLHFVSVRHQLVQVDSQERLNPNPFLAWSTFLRGMEKLEAWDLDPIPDRFPSCLIHARGWSFVYVRVGSLVPVLIHTHESTFEIPFQKSAILVSCRTTSAYVFASVFPYVKFCGAHLKGISSQSLPETWLLATFSGFIRCKIPK